MYTLTHIQAEFQAQTSIKPYEIRHIDGMQAVDIFRRIFLTIHFQVDIFFVSGRVPIHALV